MSQMEQEVNKDLEGVRLVMAVAMVLWSIFGCYWRYEFATGIYRYGATSQEWVLWAILICEGVFGFLCWWFGRMKY